MVAPDKTAPKQSHRFKPGQSGNPAGRPAGSRNRATIALEAIIEGQGEAVVNALVKAAIGGDVSAGRALLDRLVPPRKDRPVLFTLPPLVTATDAPKALAAITGAVADGTLTASEAGDLAGLVEKFVKAIEVTDHEARIKAIEERNTT